MVIEQLKRGDVFRFKSLGLGQYVFVESLNREDKCRVNPRFNNTNVLAPHGTEVEKVK